MSETINTGLQTPRIQGAPLDDLQIFGIVTFILVQLQLNGTDVRGFLSFSDGQLVLTRGTPLSLAVNAALLDQFDIELEELAEIAAIALTLDGGRLDLAADGSINEISGDVVFQNVNGTIAGTITTQFFVPPSITDVLETANLLEPSDLDRLGTYFQDYLTPTTGISYFYTGSTVDERINLGLGFSQAEGSGGDDLFRVKDDGFGNLYGGAGFDSIDGRSHEGRLFANLALGEAGTLTGLNRYSLSGFEGAIGGSLADRLIGNGLGNSLSGLGGNDDLRGLGGADTLFGGVGKDKLVGAVGNDLLHGEGGNDVLSGGAGGDTLFGGNGDDTLSGGAGGDVKFGGAGNDEMGGGDGNDSVTGNNGNDTLRGHKGNDSLYGGDGRDLLEGGDGNDVMTGGPGKDLLVGDAGNDTMSGGADRDAFIFVPFEDQGDDRILDFSQEDGDTIRFVGPAFDRSQMTITYDTATGDSVITYPDGAGGTNEIRVVDVQIVDTDLQFFGN